MPERDTDIFQWQFPLASLQSHHHRRAGAERCHQIIVWIGGNIRAAKTGGFIRLEAVVTSAASQKSLQGQSYY
jgi:hypothetical protein